MSTTSSETRDAGASEIRALQETWLKLVETKDVGRIMSLYADDLVAYDAIGPLRFQGKESYATHWKMCIEMCPGPMGFEIHDLEVAAHGDVGFSHHLLKHDGTDPESGEPSTCWLRVTSCYRKHDGRWQIAHEHLSSPFDMESGKAMFDATP